MPPKSKTAQPSESNLLISRLKTIGFVQAKPAAAKLLEVAQITGQSVNKIINTHKNKEEISKYIKLTLERSSINYSAKQPTFTRNLRGAVNISKTMFVNALQNAARHWGTPSVATAALGSILETLAVGVAAKASGVDVLYWEENAYFPGSGPGTKTTFCGGDRAAADVATVINRLKSHPGKGLILLKTVIDTAPLYIQETNATLKDAWKKVILSAATPASVNAAAKTIGKSPSKLTYDNIKRIYRNLSPISSNKSPWKGFWNAEPDGIFFNIYNGQLIIHVLEFKITKGHAETIPSEAWQMAKVKRMLQYFFASYKPIIKTVFVPWQYGQGLNSSNINFRNPYEKVKGGNAFLSNHEFSKLYRNTFNSSYIPLVWLKEDFEKNTGINAQLTQAVVEGLEREKTKKLSNMTAHMIRWSQVASNYVADSLGTSRQITANTPGVAAKNRNAAGQAAYGSSNRIKDCSNGAYGTDQPAIVIRCIDVLGTKQYDDIIRSVQRLGATYGWKPTPGATLEEANEAIRIVKNWTAAEPLWSTANLNTDKYVTRLKAWRDRMAAPGFNPSEITNRAASAFLALSKAEPSIEKTNVILSRALFNANSIKPQNVSAIVNQLKAKNAPINTWKRIFNKKALANNAVFNALLARNARNRSQGTMGAYVQNLTSRK